MLFWLLAVTITVIACAALYYASLGRTVNAAGPAGAANDSHFRLQLSEIEADTAAGRLAAGEAVAAKAELAREMLRLRRDSTAGQGRQAPLARVLLPLSTAAVVLIAFGTYYWLGSPNLPAQPLAGRVASTVNDMKLDDAIKAVEARLAAHPDDVKGWTVLAPVYMQTNQFAKAAEAFRHILELAPATADGEANLAEALMMQNNGEATGEAGDALRKAVALDPKHVRSRFYLAAEATRVKDYASAVQQWTDLIALGQDGDAWLDTAKQGLAAAEAGRDGKPLPQVATPPATAPAQAPVDNATILTMVNGLADRLNKQGGTLEEWTRLVRSEIVLGDLAKAQGFYDSARKAYPDAAARQDLDSLAAQAGLKTEGSSP